MNSVLFFKCTFLLEYRLLDHIPQDPHLRLGPRNYISDKFLGDVNDVGPGDWLWRSTELDSIYGKISERCITHSEYPSQS